MLFLIPLAEGAIEGVAVLAESTAVRAAVAEAGEALISAETRQAVSTYVTTEGRALATHLATAEGRQAMVEAVSKGASEIASNVAAKGTQVWESAKGLMATEEGAAAVQQAGKEFVKTSAKSELTSQATDYALDKLTDKVQDAIMGKSLDFFAGALPSAEMLEKFSKDTATYGTRFNLAEDMKSLSTSLAKGEHGEDKLPELAVGLGMAKDALPGKAGQIEVLQARTDSLSKLQLEEIRAKGEMDAGGKVSPETMESLRHAVSEVMAHSDPKSKDSLSNALDSLKEPHAGDNKAHFGEALSELSVAKDRVMKGLGQEVTHLSADLAKEAEHRKTEMSGSLETVVPNILAKNDQEFAKSHEQSREQHSEKAAQAEQHVEMSH